MAIKKTEETQPQKSRIWEYMKTEHKWENYVLLILSLFALILGALIMNKTLVVNDSFPLIGNFPNLFAWILIILSALSLILSLYPFFKPAWPELKKVTWPNKKLFLGNTARVFIFLITLTLLFLLYDAFISRIIALLLK